MNLKPKDAAKLLGISVEEMLKNFDGISTGSLSKLAKENPLKYEMQLSGIVCKKLNISIVELIEYKNLEKLIEEKVKNKLNSTKA